MRLIQMRVPVAPDGMGQSVPGIDLYLLSDGHVVVTQAFHFRPLYEQCLSGMRAVFDIDGFTLERDATSEDGTTVETLKQEFDWNTPYLYKEIGMLKDWLVQQQLQWPV